MLFRNIYSYRAHQLRHLETPPTKGQERNNKKNLKENTQTEGRAVIGITGKILLSNISSS